MEEAAGEVEAPNSRMRELLDCLVDCTNWLCGPLVSAEWLQVGCFLARSAEKCGEVRRREREVRISAHRTSPHFAAFLPKEVRRNAEKCGVHWTLDQPLDKTEQNKKESGYGVKLDLDTVKVGLSKHGWIYSGW